jgi:uncharacterized protein (TIGR00730 family)|tara:strand:+ start:101 stop:640 length:540 start_codon:yes stop_codon:yes gene_type:complete
MNIKSLTIYCSSSDLLDTSYYELAEKIALFLSKKKIKIIYGGGKVGIMGKISSIAHKNKGEVIGIMPKFLATKEKINKSITETIIVKSMSERKKKLFELGDAFLILPGGSGTIEEATEVISWSFLDIHKKPIILFNFKGYWDPLIQMYEKAKSNKFGNKNLQSNCKNIRSFKDFSNLFN